MMFIVLCALVALSKATDVYQSPYYVNTGTNQQYRDQDAAGNYRFGYDESHASGGTFRDETGDAAGNKWGSYGLHEADGRYRVVNYVADEQGFRAEIKSNEPGVIEKDPASTTIKHIHSEVKKPVLYAAPAPAPVPAPTAAVIHHPYNPEFPLLYSSPYYAPISTYKGTPFRRYGVHPIHTIPRSFYKGTPFVSSPKGYYIYP